MKRTGKHRCGGGGEVSDIIHVCTGVLKCIQLVNPTNLMFKI